MSAKKTSKVRICSMLWLFPLIIFPTAISATSLPLKTIPSLTRASLAAQLGWVIGNNNDCGGYYLEQPLIYSTLHEKNRLIEITSHQGLIAQRNTSTLEGKVTITRYGQQITANKVYLYRDPNTFKLSSADMIGNVHVREPNTLIVGKKGHYNFNTNAKSLIDILYRTSLNGKQLHWPSIPAEQMEKPRKINAMTAWGKAYQFSQTKSAVYELTRASYSTCPPINPTWQVKANRIILNKNTGRGYATHAKLLIKNIPVFYIPYINFPIDNRRKSGFLWPTLGVNNKFGPYFLAPFYWNIAPNADMTLTPGLLTKRGMQLSDQFRYLSHTSTGVVNLSVLPNDKLLTDFKHAQQEKFANTSDSVTQAELNRLLNSNPTRKAFSWREQSRFNDNWSSHVDFNYAGDDYYLRDFGSQLNEVSANQLLQEGEINYKTTHWDMIARLQTYQTLHPIDDVMVKNIYRRFPQLILSGNYPDQPFGFEYFIQNEITHFEILKDPGSTISLPVGNRFHLQPGISLPLYSPYLYINPRLQLALTDYELSQTSSTNAPGSIHRSLPIFDIATGLSFNRDIGLLNQVFQQTLEPQLYYTYIPYHFQSHLPLFDTTVNTLYYDQLFNYNRFSGLDRIGDANQVGIGITTRLIDQASGLEKVRLGIGNIIYFTKRYVTLCNDTSCADNPSNPSNHWRVSPITGVLDYHINPYWSVSTNTIWNPISKQLDNTTFNIRYQSDAERLINIGYNFARGGDILSGVETNSPSNNLKVTNVSFSWPVVHEVNAIGLWSQNWNHEHLQNLLYGLQYDTCCWAVRVVGGRAFTGIDPKNDNKPQYNSEFYIQFSLKGLGNVGRDASSVLSSISGYYTQFGQVF